MSKGNINPWRDVHEEEEGRYDREFKISVVAALEGYKPLA